MGLNDTSTGILKGLVVIAAIVIVLAGIKTATNILVPFLLSVFIAIICNPIVAKASEYKIPKGISVLFVIALFLVIALSIASLVGNSLNELSQLLPEYREQLKTQFSWLTDKLAHYNISISSAVLMEYFDPGAAMGLAANMLSGLGGVMANLFLIIITVVFMLLEASSLPKKLHYAFIDPEMRMKQIDRFLLSVNHYLAIKTVVSIGTGVLVSIMLWAFGLDFFLLWGVLAFLLNYIPNIGSIIAAVPAMSLAVIQLGAAPAGAIGLGYMIINTVMGNMIEPRFMGRGLGLSTLVVFLSLIFWGWLLGTVGMLLSVPLTMVIKIGLEHSKEGQWFAMLLSSEDDIAREHAEFQGEKES
ncbi:AI-2E family transporter [Colwellia sp. MEBiC06753]